MKHQRLYRNFPFSIVLYDHSCLICRHEMLRLKRLDRHERLHLVDISDSEFSETFWGFSKTSLNEALHVRRADGHWLMGIDAVRHVYQQVGLGWLWLPTRIPGLHAFSSLLYRVFARYRYGLSRFAQRLKFKNKAQQPACKNDCLSRLQ